MVLAMLSAAFAAGVDLSTRMRITTATPKSSLDRQRGRVTSTVEVTITNTGNRKSEKLLHAAILFSAESGTLEGLQVTGASRGIGQAPYQTFFFDLSGRIPGSTLPPQASVAFPLTFTPAKGARASFWIVLHGVVNGDPSANAGEPYAAQVGQGIAFNAAASADPDGDPLTFEWNFGDGSPLWTETAPRHTRPGADVFEATLTVRDNRGGVKVTRVPVSISTAQEFRSEEWRSRSHSQATR